MSVRAAVPDASNSDDEDMGIHDNLENCRSSLEAREAELVEGCRRLGREAVKRKQAGDLSGTKIKLLERKRAFKRLEKLRHSLTLVDAQLDALRTTELDKELMKTLLVSSAALKKAGVGKGVKEAEAVMTELDEQMRESSELTSVLAGGLQDVDCDFDFDEEMELLEQECELLSGVGTASLTSATVAKQEGGVNKPAVINNQNSLSNLNNPFEERECGEAPPVQHVPPINYESLTTN